MGSYRSSKATWNNAGVFSFVVYRVFNASKSSKQAEGREDASKMTVANRTVRLLLSGCNGETTVELAGIT